MRRLARWCVRTAAGRRVLLALAVAAAWLAWALTPPRPLREWTTASLEPADWLLTPDRTRFACITKRNITIDLRSFLGPIPEYGPVRLWDLATGQELLTAGVDQPTNTAVTMRVAPDGSWLLTTRRLHGPDEVVMQLWDTATGRERWSTPILINPWGELPLNYVVSPDGRFVACRRCDGTADVLDTATGRVHLPLGDAWPLAFTADGRALVVSYTPDTSRPATVRVLDTANGRLRGRFTLKQQSPAAAAFSPDDRWLAVGLAPKPTATTPAATEAVELWDVFTGQRATVLDLGTTWNPGFRGLEFSPDGSLLVISSTIGSQRAWDMTQSLPRAIDVSGFPAMAVLPSLPGIPMPGGRPACPVFAPDGTRFVAPGPDPDTLAFSETAHPQRRAIGQKRVQPIDRPQFGPDGRALAVMHPAPFLDVWKQTVNWLYKLFNWPPRYEAESRCELVFFDARTGAVSGRIGGLEAGTHLIGFGPDGRTDWTFTHTLDPPPSVPAAAPGRPWVSQMVATGDGTLRVQEWSMPSPWPPAWLSGVTALGVLLVAADWRHSRRRRPAPAAVGGRV
jgi:hypothetical protein